MDSDLPPDVDDALGTVRVLEVSVSKFYYYTHFICILFEQFIHIFEFIYRKFNIKKENC